MNIKQGKKVNVIYMIPYMLDSLMSKICLHYGRCSTDRQYEAW